MGPLEPDMGGALKAAVRYLLSSVTEAKGWPYTLFAASAVGVVYFLAARLGLALLSTPSDVAVFWPASGIAVGILVLSGRPALYRDYSGHRRSQRHQR